jgi:hypothetical protein
VRTAVLDTYANASGINEACQETVRTTASRHPLFRFRAIGSLGAFNAPTQFIDQVGTIYPFAEASILNIGSSAELTA